MLVADISINSCAHFKVINKQENTEAEQDTDASNISDQMDKLFSILNTATDMPKIDDSEFAFQVRCDGCHKLVSESEITTTMDGRNLCEQCYDKEPAQDINKILTPKGAI